MFRPSAALRPWLRLALMVSVAAALCLPLVSSSPSAAAPAAPTDYGPLPDKFLFNVGAVPFPPIKDPADAAFAPDGSVYILTEDPYRVLHFSADNRFLGMVPAVSRPLTAGRDNSLYLASDHGTLLHYSAEGRLMGEIGRRGSGDGQFGWPVSAATAPDGTLYVFDHQNEPIRTSRIQRFSPTGEFLGKWGSQGGGDGQFTDVGRLAIGPHGTVYVGDYLRGDRIQHFSPTGEFLGKWQGRGSIAGVAPDGSIYYIVEQLYSWGAPHFWVYRLSATFDDLGMWGPDPICADGWCGQGIVAPDGGMLIIDRPRNRAFRLSPDGTFVGEVGNDHSLDGQLNAPSDVAIGGNGRVYVLDRDNNRVQYFAPDGSYLGQWGSAGDKPGQFTKPGALAVAPDGTILVHDPSHRRIQRFLPDGAFLAQWDSQGTQGPGPYDLAVAADGTVYLSDYPLSTIGRFTASGEFLGWFNATAYPCPECVVPRAIALAADGTLFVIDEGKHQVKHLSADGTYLDAFLYAGANAPYIDPTGIGIAADGTIYLADNYMHQVSRFAPDGQFLGVWRAQGMRLSSNTPSITVGPDGRVYMTIPDDNVVSVFAATYPPGWRNEYYANTALVGRPYGIRTTDSVAFDWGTTPPDPALDPHRFSARFQRTLLLPGGVYTPTLDVQGGARLLINDHVVIDASTAVTGTYTATVTLPDSGYHGLRVEYAAKGEGAAVELSWGSGPKDKQVFLPALQHGLLPPPPAAPKR